MDSWKEKYKHSPHFGVEGREKKKVEREIDRCDK